MADLPSPIATDVLSEYDKKYLKYKNKYLKLKASLEKKSCLKCQSGQCHKHTMLGGSNKKELFLFKADWCPHCQNFAKTWSDLKSELSNNIKFVTYDSEKNANKIKAFKVSGFPTLILKSGNKAIEYVGPRDMPSIKNFLNKY
jgi:thiol-disulfide isomerase/thioredoxin